MNFLTQKVNTGFVIGCIYGAISFFIFVTPLIGYFFIPGAITYHAMRSLVIFFQSGSFDPNSHLGTEIAMAVLFLNIVIWGILGYLIAQGMTRWEAYSIRMRKIYSNK